MRQPLDFYETPPHYLEALLDSLKILRRSTILDPCVGEGAISDRLIGDGHRVITNDLDPTRPALFHMDATSPNFWQHMEKKGLTEWMVVNPPFEHIEVILTNAMAGISNIVTLARLSFLEPTIFRRQFFMAFGQPEMVIVLPRYKFSEPSKDTMTCCWLGWGPRVPKTFKIWTEGV